MAAYQKKHLHVSVCYVRYLKTRLKPPPAAAVTVNRREDKTIFLTELAAPFQITEGAFRKMTKLSREVHCRQSKRTTGPLACPPGN